MTAVDPFAVIEAVFPRAKPTPAARPAILLGSAAPDTAYAASALEQEAQRVIDAPEGTRNHALNRAAYSLGQLVAGGALDEADVVDTLSHGARQAGLEDREIRLTIASGLAGGQATPRGVPAPVDVDSWLRALPVAERPAERIDPETGEVLGADPEDDAAALSALIRERLPTLDWQALWDDDSTEEWIIEPLLPARRLVALYSAPKVGKSLLMLELAVAICTGRPVLGVNIDRPRRVLYVDFENDPKADIRERLQAMGVGPADLGWLHYLSFPTLNALDSDLGGRELMAAVAEYQCEVVVIDTVSRSIAGEENENDTWLSFYRHTGLRMKQQGIAMVRLDHAGKDESKGQRGGSAKSGDVDAVWRMSRLTDDSYRLDCEAARMPIHEKTLVLHREIGPLRHRVDAEGRQASVRIKVDKAVEVLDKARTPNDAGRPTITPIIRAAGLKLGTKLLGDVLSIRQNRPYSAVPEVGDSAPSEHLSPMVGDSPGQSEAFDA